MLLWFLPFTINDSKMIDVLILLKIDLLQAEYLPAMVLRRENRCLRCSSIWVLLPLEVNRHHRMIREIGIEMRLLRRDYNEIHMMIDDLRHRI